LRSSKRVIHSVIVETIDKQMKVLSEGNFANPKHCLAVLSELRVKLTELDLSGSLPKKEIRDESWYTWEEIAGLVTMVVTAVPEAYTTIDSERDCFSNGTFELVCRQSKADGEELGLIVTGDVDPVVTTAAIARWNKILPNVTFIEFVNAGVIYVNEPDKWTRHQPAD